MRSPLKFILELVSIILLVEFAYWTTSNFIVFNSKTLDTTLEFLFYLLPSLVALALTILLKQILRNISPFISKLILVLINAYSFLCIIMLTSGYCDFEKNLDLIYSVIVVLILVAITIIIIKNVLPKMSRKDILIASLATAIAFYDFLFSLVGYGLFYPGNW